MPASTKPTSAIPSSQPIASTSKAVAPNARQSALEDKMGQIRGVEQPLHQIVHTSKFIADDEAGPDEPDSPVADGDEEEEWTGFGSGDEDSTELPALSWEDVMGEEGVTMDTEKGEESASVAAEEVDQAFGDVFSDDDDAEEEEEDSDDVEIVLDAPEDPPAFVKSKKVGNGKAPASSKKRGALLWS